MPLIRSRTRQPKNESWTGGTTAQIRLISSFVRRHTRILMLYILKPLKPIPRLKRAHQFTVILTRVHAPRVSLHDQASELARHVAANYQHWHRATAQVPSVLCCSIESLDRAFFAPCPLACEQKFTSPTLVASICLPALHCDHAPPEAHSRRKSPHGPPTGDVVSCGSSSMPRNKDLGTPH